MIKNEVIFKKSLLDLQKTKFEKVHIAGIWPSHGYSSMTDVRNKPLWYFAGSVFGGPADSLIVFADKLKDKVAEAIRNKYLTWEINHWYLVFQENAHLFDVYYCDHNRSILENY